MFYVAPAIVVGHCVSGAVEYYVLLINCVICRYIYLLPSTWVTPRRSREPCGVRCRFTPKYLIQPVTHIQVGNGYDVLSPI